jgi:hypothetical protein
MEPHHDSISKVPRIDVAHLQRCTLEAHDASSSPCTVPGPFVVSVGWQLPACRKVRIPCLVGRLFATAWSTDVMPRSEQNLADYRE